MDFYGKPLQALSLEEIQELFVERESQLLKKEALLEKRERIEKSLINTLDDKERKALTTSLLDVDHQLDALEHLEELDHQLMQDLLAEKSLDEEELQLYRKLNQRLGKIKELRRHYLNAINSLEPLEKTVDELLTYYKENEKFNLFQWLRSSLFFAPTKTQIILKHFTKARLYADHAFSQLGFLQEPRAAIDTIGNFLNSLIHEVETHQAYSSLNTHLPRAFKAFCAAFLALKNEQDKLEESQKQHYEEVKKLLRLSEIQIK